jgi:hypothetical protein
MLEKLGTALPVPNQLGHRYCTYALKRGSRPVNVARFKFSALKALKAHSISNLENSVKKQPEHFFTTKINMRRYLSAENQEDLAFYYF